MSGSDYEISLEAFELLEARQLAEQNLHAVIGMVDVARQSNLHMATHNFKLLHNDYQIDNNRFYNPDEARRIAAQATDLFYALFDDEQRTPREIRPQDDTTTAQYVLWEATIAGQTVNIIEQSWQPQTEYDLGVSVAAHVYRPEADQQAVETREKQGSKIGRFISRLFRK